MESTRHRIETRGSWWMIDEGAGLYWRFPMDEGGRECPEWGDDRAGPLQDAVPHEFTGRWRYDKFDGLRIEVERLGDGRARVVKAPPSLADWVDALGSEFWP